MEENKNTDEIVDIMELVPVVWARRRLICIYLCVGIVAGLVVAFGIPRTYQTTMKLAMENQNASRGNLGGFGSAAGLGGQGEKMDVTTIEIYPDIVASTPFLLELAEVPVPFTDHASDRIEQIPLMEYVVEHQKRSWWTAFFGLPKTLIEKKTLTGKDGGAIEANENYRILPPPYKSFIESMKESVQVEMDKKSMILYASVTMQDPVISAVVADSVVAKLLRYMVIYRTQKITQDLEQYIRQYEEAKTEFYEMDDKLADAIDRNLYINSESLKIVIERLRNERQLKYDLYNQAAKQVELTKIKLQEETPLATIIEPAIVPHTPSAPNRKIILLVFCFFSVCVAIGVILWPYFFPKKTVTRPLPGAADNDPVNVS